MTTVSVDGVTFEDGDAQWMLEREGLGGWFDGPPVRAEDVPRPQAHGSFGVPAQRGARIVSVNVTVRCASAAEAEDARDRLAGILAGGQIGDLAVTSDAGRTTSSAVRLNAKPLIAWRPWSNTVRAQLEFFAPDPLRYADAISRTTGFAEQRGGLEFPLFTDGTTDTGFLEFGEQGSTGRVTLPAQPGTAPGHTQFLVRGPVPAFSIIRVETGRRITFARSVAAGDRLLIDSATGVALLNDGDVDYSGLLTYWEWEPIMPGESATFAFVPDGLAQAGTLTVIHRAAWW